MVKKKKKKKKVAKKRKKAKKKGTRRHLKKKSRRGSKKAFGGYTINFKGCKDPVENIFGKSAIAPSQMTKKLWAYVKRKRLNTK
jgi:hypothetical protein